MTKTEWLRQCREWFMERGGVDEKGAAEMAETSWEVAVADEGSEELALEYVDPAGSADIEMSYWEP